MYYLQYPGGVVIFFRFCLDEVGKVKQTFQNGPNPQPASLTLK